MGNVIGDERIVINLINALRLYITTLAIEHSSVIGTLGRQFSSPNDDL